MESCSPQDDKCPICHEHIDHEEPINCSCELCGMAVHDRSNAPCYSNAHEGDVHFCCGRCHSIYVSEVHKNKHLLEFLKMLNSNGTSREDVLMKEVIIDCINKKYPVNTKHFGR